MLRYRWWSFSTDTQLSKFLNVHVEEDLENEEMNTKINQRSIDLWQTYKYPEYFLLISF